MVAMDNIKLYPKTKEFHSGRWGIYQRALNKYYIKFAFSGKTHKMKSVREKRLRIRFCNYFIKE